MFGLCFAMGVGDERRSAAAAEMEKLAQASPPSSSKGGGVVTLAQERQLIKHEFEQKKKTVLASIPSSHKSLWGHGGFARTVLENDWVPCLFLAPYNVPPTSAMRQLYLDMLTKVEEKETMPVLVHWYGSLNCSLVPFKYIQVICKKQIPLPLDIQNKIDYGHQLSWKDQCVHRAHWELNQDLNLEPKLRFRGEPFGELYQDDKYVLSVMAVNGRIAPDAIALQEEAATNIARTTEERAAKKSRTSPVYDVHAHVGSSGESKTGERKGGFYNTVGALVGKLVHREKTPVVSPEEANKNETSTVKEAQVRDYLSPTSGTTPWPTGYTTTNVTESTMGNDSFQSRVASVAPTATTASLVVTTKSGSATGKAMSAKFFTAVMEPIKGCQTQILQLSRDESLNHEEIVKETTFWRRQENKWKSCLLFFDHEGIMASTEAILKNAESFSDCMGVITECQEQIKIREKDMTRTRVEIARETKLWRDQEKEWKGKLPKL